MSNLKLRDVFSELLPFVLIFMGQLSGIVVGLSIAENEMHEDKYICEKIQKVECRKVWIEK